ncbi:MAG: GNAT family N-acetyltransferase [Clostridia bacterium]|nr:GNAT family N-acetyltransferase [Clostridia bacterium]
MKIKRTNENRYVALDDRDMKIGYCSVTRKELPWIFADVPAQYVIKVSCDDECRDVLCGAAVTRARLLAMKEQAPSRVFADLDPKDVRELETLKALGFTRTDGINRMTRRVTDERITLPVPVHCTIVRDFLENEDERKKCLRRYNDCFGENRDMAWLMKLTSRRDFARILIVSPSELCGEVMVWSQGYTGVIGIIQVARAWRRKGVGSYLVEDARKYFASIGMRDITFDVWLSAPGSLPLARKCGFRRGEMIRQYPTLEI